MFFQENFKLIFSLLLALLHTVHGVYLGQYCGTMPNIKRYMLRYGIFGCYYCDADEYWDGKAKTCTECSGYMTNLSPNILTSCRYERIETERHQVRKVGTTFAVKIDTDELPIPSTIAKTTSAHHISTISVLVTKPTVPKKPINIGKEVEKLDGKSRQTYTQQIERMPRK